MIADLHRALALVTAAGAVVLVILAAGGRLAGGASRLWIDRAILGLLAVIGLAILSGLALLLGGGGPDDPLHFLYAVAALLTLPVARAWATGDHAGRRWLAMALAGAVLGGVVVRLFMTGGS